MRGVTEEQLGQKYAIGADTATACSFGAPSTFREAALVKKGAFCHTKPVWDPAP